MASGSSTSSASLPKATCPVDARLRYFERLFSESALEVRDDGVKGVGVYAKKSFEEGEVLFGEEPDATVKWRRSPLACEHCMKALGSMEFQMRHLHDDTVTPADSGIEALPDVSEAEAKLSEVKRGWSPFREVAWFCSDDCVRAEEKAFEALKPQEEAVRAFVRQAFEAGVPFFLLALKVMLRASGLVDHLLQRPYWECIDVPDANPVGFLEEIRADLSSSWQLLKNLNFPGRPESLEAYSHFVGCLCLNVIAVKYANPLIYYIQEVDQGRGGAEAKQKLRPILEAIEKRQDDEENEDIDSESDLEDDELSFSWPSTVPGGKPWEFSSSLFPPIKGYGLFPCLSACNHSCDPSAEVLFAGSRKLLLIARRGLKAGDEVCISYIDHEEADTEKRQQALQSYGFRCDCHRCRPKPSGKRKRTTGKARSKRGGSGSEPPSKASKTN